MSMRYCAPNAASPSVDVAAAAGCKAERLLLRACAVAFGIGPDLPNHKPCQRCSANFHEFTRDCPINGGSDLGVGGLSETTVDLILV
jgi:hypothetical protein